MPDWTMPDRCAALGFLTKIIRKNISDFCQIGNAHYVSERLNFKLTFSQVKKKKV